MRKLPQPGWRRIQTLQQIKRLVSTFSLDELPGRDYIIDQINRAIKDLME